MWFNNTVKLILFDLATTKGVQEILQYAPQPTIHSNTP